MVLLHPVLLFLQYRFSVQVPLVVDSGVSWTSDSLTPSWTAASLDHCLLRGWSLDSSFEEDFDVTVSSLSGGSRVLLAFEIEKFFGFPGGVTFSGSALPDDSQDFANLQ